jgi:hypothetical protein
MPTTPSYLECREKFLQSARGAGFAIHSEPLPGSGIQGEALFQDYAFLDQSSEVSLVHLSGVHGVEGYLGSAAQTHALELRKFPVGVNLLFVHAVNPYGMSWYRRVNSQNVDLNRNGVDFSKPRPAKPAVFLGKSFWWNAIKSLGLHGYRATAQAIAGGQYQDPRQIFFGGSVLQPELESLAKNIFPIFPRTRRWILWDVHTGLGPFNQESLFVRNLSAGAQSRGWWTSGIAPARSLYEPEGQLVDFLTRGRDETFECITQEIGTYHSLRTLHCLLQDNRDFQVEPRSARRIRRMLDTFYPRGLSIPTISELIKKP